MNQKPAKMKSKLLLVMMVVFYIGTAHAQYENTTGGKKPANRKSQPRKAASPLSKIYVGGNIGGGWSNTSAYFEVSPIIGYRATPALDVGTRLTYIYSKYSYYNVTTSYHDMGAAIFARYHFLEMLFLHAEFEELSAQYYPGGINDGKSRRWVPGLFLGGGIYRQMGMTFLHVGILYNVLDTQYSPYTNPVIRIGFGVGL